MRFENEVVLEKRLTAFCQKHGSYTYKAGEDASSKCLACKDELSIVEKPITIYDDCADTKSKFVKSGIEVELHDVNINNLNEHALINQNQHEYLRNYVSTFDKSSSKNLVVNAVNFEKINTISAAITLSLLESGVNVAYASNFNFFNKIRESNNFKSENYVNSRKIYQKADLLIVDNFSPKFLSEFQLGELQSLIDHRYGNCLPTIFLTTFDVEKFFKLVGEKVETRITSNFDYMNI